MSTDIKEALENADEIAELTGREKSDVVADLLDDGKLNQSNTTKENTTAIEKATAAARHTHKLLTALIPILLLLATSGLELGGIIDLTPAGSGDDEWMWEEEYQEEYYYGCTDYSALNYDEYANYDDGTCEYEQEEEQEEVIVCDPFFYDNYTNFLDNNTKIQFSYDVDLDCDETQDVQVQFLAYENNSTSGDYPNNYSIDEFEVYNGDVGYRNITLSNFTKGKYDIYAYLINGDGEMITELIWTGIEIEGVE